MSLKETIRKTTTIIINKTITVLYKNHMSRRHYSAITFY